MPALFIFLLKVNAALLLFCAGYYLALRRLTFYTLNRVYLVAAILFASVYPEINLSDFVQHNRELTKPVQMVIVNWQAPAEKLIKPAAVQSYWQWIEVTFWAGVVLLSIKLLVQLFSLVKLYRNSAAGQIYGHKVRVIKGNAGPFSFWKSIFVNPANHQQADLKAILLHEQVHVNEWHTLDILLAELSTIFYWFNPAIWLMKKAIRENIEFITDRKILNKGADSKQYQYSLVNVSFAANSNGLVNHFNISTIKKRIIMMNAKKSSKLNLTRYALLVPAVTALLLIFTVSNAALIKKKTITLRHVVNVIRMPQFKLAEKTQQFIKPVVSAIKSDKKSIAVTVIYEKTKASASVDTIKKVAVTGTGTSSLSISARNGMDTNRITKIRINGTDYKAGNVVVTNVKLNMDTIMFDTIIRPKLKHNLKFAEVQVKGFKTQPWTSSSLSFGSTFSLNHLSDKLIIIDGKTATEKDLKKLSAFEIDRMVLKTDEETKELYGDKAKNGVVFIVTKKSSK